MWSFKEHTLKCNQGEKWQWLWSTIWFPVACDSLCLGSVSDIPKRWGRNRKTYQAFSVRDVWDESIPESPAMFFMAPDFTKPWKILNIWTRISVTVIEQDAGLGLCWWSSFGKWRQRVDLLPFPLLLSGCFFNFLLRYFPGNREISGQKASIKEGFMTFCT